MKERSEKTKDIIIWTLTFLIIVLIAIIIWLFIIVTKANKEEKNTTGNQITQTPQVTTQTNIETSTPAVEIKTLSVDNKVVTTAENSQKTSNSILTANEVLTTIGMYKNSNNEINENETKNFCIRNVEETENGYIITANLLEEEPRKVIDEEYQSILQGNEFEFRGDKWKIKTGVVDSYNTIFLDNTSREKVIAIGEWHSIKETKYVLNPAGSPSALADYSGKTIRFTVDKNILICKYWEYFAYDSNGNIHQYSLDGNEEITPMKLINMEELIKGIKNASGIYEECSLCIRNGKIDAIQCLF